MRYAYYLAKASDNPLIPIELSQMKFTFISMHQHHSAIARHLINNAYPIFRFHTKYSFGKHPSLSLCIFLHVMILSFQTILEAVFAVP